MPNFQRHIIRGVVIANDDNQVTIREIFGWTKVLRMPADFVPVFQVGDVATFEFAGETITKYRIHMETHRTSDGIPVVQQGHFPVQYPYIEQGPVSGRILTPRGLTRMVEFSDYPMQELHVTDEHRYLPPAADWCTFQLVRVWCSFARHFDFIGTVNGFPAVSVREILLNWTSDYVSQAFRDTLLSQVPRIPEKRIVLQLEELAGVMSKLGKEHPTSPFTAYVNQLVILLQMQEHITPIPSSDRLTPSNILSNLDIDSVFEC